ncbi:hypothetical protein AGMMS49928_06210 [Spirochaetia bacterium]|nr:hypothetical protein AGMMS49928_06210 [Spirochaetia bacterium]
MKSLSVLNEELLPLIDRSFPLPGRFRQSLKFDIAELSRLLTGSRGDRSETYLGKPNLLSAYLRYFLPWNLYRLCRLLPSLPITLEDGDAVTDLGSGPLTLVLALWMAKPEYRGLNLEFRCLDRTGAALEKGMELFRALAGKDCPWKIRPIRASLGAPIHGDKARLTTAVNLFNEVYQKIPEADRSWFNSMADKNARLLNALTAANGSILVMEPGNPRGGAFITALRAGLIPLGRLPIAPCPHQSPCPLDAAGKWCHFVFDTASGKGAAPPDLLKLSEAAGLPKERAALSFLLAGSASSAKNESSAGEFPVRIISDPFPVGSGIARYGCSEKGLILVTGTREKVEAAESGALIQTRLGPDSKRDQKSGALIAGLTD